MSDMMETMRFNIIDQVQRMNDEGAMRLVSALLRNMRDDLKLRPRTQEEKVALAEFYGYDVEDVADR